MPEKVGRGLLYHTAWSLSQKGLPLSKPLEELGLAHRAHLEVPKGTLNATPVSLTQCTQVKTLLKTLALGDHS